MNDSGDQGDTEGMGDTESSRNTEDEARAEVRLETADLQGLVVVVAGATGAAGPALVTRLAGAGATVVAIGTHEDRLHRVVEMAAVASGSDRIEAAVVDLLDAEATQTLARELVARHGHVDGLAHLVGGWRGGASLVEEPLADWDWLNDLLIRTLMSSTRAFHDALRDSPCGRLVLISTTQTQAPSANNAMYAAAKAAAETWTLAVADSFAGSAAAAVILPIKALLTPAMRAAKPDAKFTGYTHVADLADTIHDLWGQPAADLNGKRL
ncbi:MAG: SDR family oxidoreductase [Dermatophilaceae bacterium]